MKKEFIPYELALRLKAIDFNEPCFGYYYTLNRKDWKFAEKTEYWKLDDEINIGGKFTLLAPTLSQAFRWFREKGYLISFSSHDTSIHDFYIKWQPSKSILSDTYDTCEEAELACLEKLIEIAEKQNLQE